MMREKYESLSAAALKDIAKARGLRNISTLKKSQLVERMLEEDAKEEAARGEAEKAAKAEPAEKIEETGKGENPEPETKPERNSRAAGRGKYAGAAAETGAWPKNRRNAPQKHSDRVWRSV